MSKRARYDEDELYVEIEDPLYLDYDFNDDPTTWLNCDTCGCAKPLDESSFNIYDTEDDKLIYGEDQWICLECTEKLELAYIEKASPECILSLVSHEWRTEVGRGRYMDRLSNL